MRALAPEGQTVCMEPFMRPVLVCRFSPFSSVYSAGNGFRLSHSSDPRDLVAVGAQNDKVGLALVFPRRGCVLLGGVADLARCAASGGNTELRQQPLRQCEPNSKHDDDHDPIVHCVVILRQRRQSRRSLIFQLRPGAAAASAAGRFRPAPGRGGGTIPPVSRRLRPQRPRPNCPPSWIPPPSLPVPPAVPPMFRP